ncbi:MAG: class A beta-lactamase-related serine hydrolase [Chitinophagaceae bacterium]|nr:MAG: class A beta-lactamase-related serine hydrolase [Chitinophagaceae bacterium]
MKKLSGQLVLVFACILSGYLAHAQDLPPLPDYVKKITDSAFAKNNLPGILVAYSDNGKDAFYTAGFAEPETKRMFDLHTFFEIGSITKTFTAYCLMSVLRDHHISDTTSILPFLPSFVQSNKALEPIRFLNLMNHTSGLPRLPANMILKENDLQPYQDYDSKMLFDNLAVIKPGKPGKYEYSNLGAGLAGVLAERIAGRSYAQLLDQYIFIPFKMLDEGNTLAMSEFKSQGYIADSTKAVYWNMNVLAPAGGLKCTGKEMLKYLAEMSRPHDNQTRDMVEILTQSTQLLSPERSVARAWHTAQKKDRPTIYWHNGGTYGFSTFAAFVKETRQTVLVVINKFNSNAVSDKLGMEIINKMLE